MTPPGFPRRILMTADCVGGVWNYALELSRGLAAHGVDVVLATMGPRPTAEQRADAVALGNVTLCESEYRLEWMPSPWGDVQRAGDWLLDLEARFAPEVIHLNGYVHGALPWTAPVMITGHSCVCSWWRAVRGGEVPPAWSRYRARVRAGLHAARLVTAPTRAMLDALNQEYGPLARRMVIPNGCRPTEFAPAPRKEPFILSVGRLWDEAKNAAALAAIAPALPWPVRVAGSITAPDGGQPVLPHVEPLGHCDRRVLAAHYGRAAIYALPARYEPFGLSALEAALSGCALVLGDIPTLRELWSGAAMFVAPDDHAALHANLSELIDNWMLRQWLGARARQRALEYAAERLLAGYLAAYESLLARRADSSRDRTVAVRPREKQPVRRDARRGRPVIKPAMRERRAVPAINGTDDSR